jgi:hypothetical protein
MPHFSTLGSLASSPWIDFTISRRAEFPGGREKCREFRRICLPYAAEQGIYSSEQGINSAFSTGAGNLARSRFLRAT